MSSKRVTVYEAAQALGLSVDAIRKRVQRGAIPHEKDSAGRVHILLDDYETLQDDYGTSSSGLIEQLRSENAYLREQLEEANTRDRENRRLLAAALERLPELESSERSEDSAEQAPAQEPDPEPGPSSPEPSASAQPRRSWWRRLIGG